MTKQSKVKKRDLFLKKKGLRTLNLLKVGHLRTREEQNATFLIGLVLTVR